MNLFDLIVLLLIVLTAIMFWRFRAIAETANQHLHDYCERQNLQLLSIARIKTRIGSYRGKLDLHSEFSFEFSGNGEDSYKGVLTMVGLKALDLYTPAYRIQ
ncbi:MAG: DUF3301 domain-containing protein [Paraglaciecola sp.]|uniref:DUF3301 domain-containing protein n=1 Tax=Pseudomonadati TaxID=3379134 RepID=UPI00273F6139|nr:DUF3301 domain-containing protein [Paraglaciecola sp.]MDP5031457.1 DUF3301 domain-containing protein [Paraglaciecola sp.]MDP5130802.1 DUF3301 domain-containing protein [Paraglaciecola sp.]